MKMTSNLLLTLIVKLIYKLNYIFKVILKCSYGQHRLKYTMIFIKIDRNYLQIIITKYWNFYIRFIYLFSTTIMRMCLLVMQAR